MTRASRRTSLGPDLDVEAEQDHVAVVDGVVLAFLAHLAGFLGGRLAAGGDVVVVADGLRAGEAC